MPIIVSIEHGEGDCVVVQLVSFQFVKDVVQAIGNALCTSKFFFVHIVDLSVELFDLSVEFLLVVLSLSQFFFHSLVLSSEGIEVLLGEEGALSDEFSVSSGDTEVVEDTDSSNPVCVVERNLSLPGIGDVGDNVEFGFGKEMPILAQANFQTSTNLQLRTHIVISTCIVEGHGETSTAEQIPGSGTIGFPAVEGVEGMPNQVHCCCPVVIHSDFRIHIGIVSTRNGFVGIFQTTKHVTEHTGCGNTDSCIGATVNLFLEEQ